MLLSFKIKNFLSYKDESQLLMTSVKSFKELKKDNLFTEREFEILKTAAVYGSNGGGKSNLIKAMGMMTSIVHNSFAESLKKEEDKSLPVDYYFKLNSETITSPTEFEVVFIKNKLVYRYGFKIKGHDIIKEWLYQKKEVETNLFLRELNQFKINNNSFAEGNEYKEKVNQNILFISYLAQNNTKVATEIFNWFNNLNVVNAIVNTHYEKVSKELLRNDAKFKIWLSYAVNFLNISNVDIDSQNKIVTYHNKFDNNNLLVETIPFELDVNESEGTKKLIYILGAIYDSLLHGKVLFVDELDSKLHPNLTKKLIHFFHEFNKKKAQFIFTLHDSNLLDKDIFRRDQIWFVDKNKLGSSELYSLSDFDAKVVRNTSDYRKKYLDLTFGAANSLDVTNELINLMYD